MNNFSREIKLCNKAFTTQISNIQRDINVQGFSICKIIQLENITAQTNSKMFSLSPH